MLLYDVCVAGQPQPATSQVLTRRDSRCHGDNLSVDRTWLEMLQNRNHRRWPVLCMIHGYSCLQHVDVLWHFSQVNSHFKTKHNTYTSTDAVGNSHGLQKN